MPHSPLISQHTPLASAGAPPVGMARCSACAHFGTRTRSSPEGWCRRFSVETWPAPLFQCGAYRPADRALVDLARRRAEVVKALRAHPALRHAFDVVGASPAGPAAEPVSVMLGLRDCTGAIVTAEMRVPAERWDMAAFVAYWNAQDKPS